MKQRIGPRMAQAVSVVCNNPGCTKKFVAERVGPNGSLQFGYRTVDRCIRAGLIQATYDGGRYSLTTEEVVSH